MRICGKTMEMGKWGIVVLAIVMVAGTTGVVEAQEDADSCVTALVPCSDYLNSTNPPTSCCTPLRQAVATQLKCLCGLLNDKSLFQSVNINLTQALELPKHCGIADTTSACSKFSVSPPPPAAGAHHTPHHPPPTLGTIAHSPTNSTNAHTPIASATAHAPTTSAAAHTPSTLAPASTTTAYTPSASPAAVHVPSALPAHTPPHSGASGNGVAWNGMPCWLVLLAFMVV